MVEDDEAEPDTSDFERLMEDFHDGAKNTRNEFNTLINDTWMQLMKCEITINAQLEVCKFSQTNWGFAWSEIVFFFVFLFRK